MRHFALLLLLFTLITPATRPAQAQSRGWRDTPFRFDSSSAGDRYGFLNYTCWDPINPGQLLVAENGIGIARYDLRSGSRTLITPAGRFNRDGCGETGWLYWGEGDAQGMIAFPPDGGESSRLSPLPTTFARDGSATFYGLLGTTVYAGAAGAMNDIRATPFAAGAEVTLQVSGPDARALYALVIYRPKDPAGLTRYEIWFSPTGGNTHPATGGAPWELRSSAEVGGSYGGPYIQFVSLGDALAPVGTLMLSVDPGHSGSSGVSDLLLSTDGGRTFNVIEKRGMGSLSYGTFYAVRDGIMRFSVSSTMSYGPRSFSLSLTRDGGATWQDLGKPALPATPESYNVQIVVARAAPQVIALGDVSGTYLSTDSGQHWARVGDLRGELEFSPYVPLQLLGRNGGTLSLLDVGDLGGGMTAARPALRDQGYAPETGQTISPLFNDYWQRNGGLARFGYPRSAAFREVNAADGRAYLTQYFERARFEYHPENRDPQYHVLLGLLGNERTVDRRGEGPFLPKAGAAGERFFPETGHAIRNSFQSYWERNGGLAVYGYPISDEFTEINPEDGKPYVVQYFERNRFEYHPEHAGTPYEVLLGLLGNDLLRLKGWL
jgi:hypothetical protein